MDSTFIRATGTIIKFAHTTFCIELPIQNVQNSTYPDAGYPDRLGPSGSFVKNSTKLTCLQITSYQIKYSTVVWLIELQISCDQMV